MEANYILVRFGELTTKGKNRKLFTNRLLKNTKEILAEFNHLTYEDVYKRQFLSPCYILTKISLLSKVICNLM